jgi:peptidoglycan/LPS O-acetylase OafA/YrhL
VTHPESAPADHLLALDGLRALAILLVLSHNLSVFGGQLEGPSRWVELAFDFGWAGVQLFFVLSGFLITRGLLRYREARHYFRRFYTRRALRIVPLYALALTVLLVVVPALGLSTPTLDNDRKHQAWLWLYLTNWDPYFARGNSVVNHFWSLAIEEQFYLVWPFLVRRCAPRQLICVCIGTAACSLLWRFLQVGQGVDPGLIYVSTFARFDALALGSAVAVITTLPKSWARVMAAKNWLWPAAACMFVLGMFATRGAYPQSSPLGQTVGYGWLSILFALTLLAAAVGERSPAALPRIQGLLTWRPLTHIGKISYGIYVIHKPIHDLVVKPWWLTVGVKPTNSIAVALIALGCETLLYIALATILYRYFERRFLLLRPA